MLHHARRIAGTLVLGAMLVGIGLAMPALAEQQGSKLVLDAGYQNDDDSCLTVKQVQKKLKRAGYKDLSYVEQYSEGPILFFVGVKPKRDGTDVVWHLYYQSCERELVQKLSQE